MMAIVDVLIPTFNSADTLEAAINSIQLQTLSDIIIHVIDDGSFDESRDILARLSRSDSRIKVYTTENCGIVEALNLGLSFCGSEYIARHDSDDLAYPARLEDQVDFLRNNRDVVAVGASARHIGPDGKPLGTFAEPHLAERADSRAIPSREPYIIHPLLMVRREAIETVGKYRYAYHAEDTDLYWRLADQGRLINLPHILADYRIHNGSISSASALNGRIMAINSQRAALSARRRQIGYPDIEFRKCDLMVLTEAGSFERMIDCISQSLSPEEREYLVEAGAAKLLELTSYRPYELERSDCSFIGKRARHGYRNLSPEVRRLQQRHVSGAAARLAANGRWSDAFRLLPARLLPGFAARVFLRTIVPKPFRRFFQRGETRVALSK